MQFNIDQYRSQGLNKDQIIEKLRLVNDLQSKQDFDEEAAANEIDRLDKDTADILKRLKVEQSMLKIHRESAQNLKKKLQQEQDKYEEIVAQKAKLIADMQGLLQIFEDNKKRQLEEFAKAYLREHIIIHHENPLSLP